ncbi:stage II sporulation protein M [Fructilactobacillus frigidiflavus]|uniref:stage II sporulation protein M n=1 Tax=Fructilactobacillus frigidiflavus TaxID=3242688 RepID=UPI003757D100
MKILKNNPIDTKVLKKISILFISIIFVTMLITIIAKIDVLKLLKNIYSGSLPVQNNQKGFLSNLSNDTLKLPLFTLMLALIPIPYLFTVVFFFNSIILGMLFATPFVEHNLTMFLVILGTFPTVILEGLALLITYIGGLYINKAICSKIYKNQKIKLTSIILSSIKLYLIYTIPLSTLSVLIETFVTPKIIHLF